MIIRTLAVIVGVVVVVLLAAIFAAGRGWLGTRWEPVDPTGSAIPAELIAERAATQRDAALAAGVEEPKQILFGDLHVHTTYSIDAFLMALPMTGGDGAHPVADACDFARHCSGLDFWSINDHGLSLTPQRWSETIDAIRQCNAVAGDPAAPDVVAYLGWEWTQLGSKPENHYGHKNVILRELDDGSIPTRPIMAGPPPDTPPALGGGPPTMGLGLAALLRAQEGGLDLATVLREITGVPRCPDGVPVRDLPADCREAAPTPRDLFAKLDDWGVPSMVIPHGTTWGMYTPPGSSWDKQLDAAQHDPDRQRLIEVYSGHGSSEEYRDWSAVVLNPDGTRSCPEPTEDYVPSCWRAGEIIAERCEEAGESDDVCETRAEEARQNWVDADNITGRLTVPGASANDWLDAGQCNDCFQPSFNYRPKSSVQYLMSLRNPDESGPQTFRFGFMAASDNHSARPGTGYKEYARTTMTEARFSHFGNTPLGRTSSVDPQPMSVRSDAAMASLSPFVRWEVERASSFFLTGGLAAVHANGRDRGAIWDALERREVYGTSGPRILLWFDLLDSAEGAPVVPMGGETTLSTAPTFRVRAVGSFEQEEGCPDASVDGLPAERLERLCRGECYHPSDERRPIDRIEVVRIRPVLKGGDVAEAIEDPWRVYPCEPDPTGCQVLFSDDEFAATGQDTVYYVRAIEPASEAIDIDPLFCDRDDDGRCVEVDPCREAPDDDDCLAETEQRAWSSPIFVDYGE